MDEATQITCTYRSGFYLVALSGEYSILKLHNVVQVHYYVGANVINLRIQRTKSAKIILNRLIQLVCF